MGDQLKPDTPTIIKRIIQEASLPQKKSEDLHKLNRHQLLELYMYITEVKKTNKELKLKLETFIAQGSNGENNG